MIIIYHAHRLLGKSAFACTTHQSDHKRKEKKKETFPTFEKNQNIFRGHLIKSSVIFFICAAQKKIKKHRERKSPRWNVVIDLYRTIAVARLSPSIRIRIWTEGIDAVSKKQQSQTQKGKELKGPYPSPLLPPGVEVCAEWKERGRIGGGIDGWTFPFPAEEEEERKREKVSFHLVQSVSCSPDSVPVAGHMRCVSIAGRTIRLIIVPHILR